MSKRIALFLSLLSLAILTMIAAVVPATAQDATATPPPTPTLSAQTQGSGSTQLTILHGLTGGDGDAFNKMVAAFVEANPDFAINNQALPWDQMFQRLQASFVAGDPPDVFIVHTAEIPQFASLGIMRPSDDLLDTNGGPLPAADYAGLDATLYDGQHYGVLFDNHGFGTWVNKGLFDKAGLDATNPPKDAQEFIDWATKLTVDANGKHPDEAGFDANNVAQWGAGIDWARVQFESWLFQFGGTIVSEDGKTATLNSDAGHQALQFMVDMVQKYHIAPDPSKVNGYNAFQAGIVAMMPSGTWFRNVLVDQHPEITWTAWPMLQVGPKPATWVNGHVMFISPSLDGDKLAAAEKFVEWMSNNNGLWASAGHVPARISAQAALDPKTYSSNIVFGQGFQTSGVFEPQLLNITEVTNAYDPEISAALNGQKTVDQALNDANTRMQAVLDRGQ